MDCNKVIDKAKQKLSEVLIQFGHVSLRDFPDNVALPKLKWRGQKYEAVEGPAVVNLAQRMPKISYIGSLNLYRLVIMILINAPN